MAARPGRGLNQRGGDFPATLTQSSAAVATDTVATDTVATDYCLTQAARTWVACGPFGPWVTSNSTGWFSSRLRKP